MSFLDSPLHVLFAVALGFIIGYIVGTAKANRKHRAVLIDISKGHCIPDENGNVGWVVP